jgi:hypothetical protein
MMMLHSTIMQQQHKEYFLGGDGGSPSMVEWFARGP